MSLRWLHEPRRPLRHGLDAGPGRDGGRGHLERAGLRRATAVEE
jgi:hypothetical protein